MDLRDDILESISRIHNRPLLLENSDQRAPQAASILAGADWQDHPQMPNYKLAVIGGKQYSWNQSNNKLQGPNSAMRATFNGSNLGIPGGKNPEDALTKLISSLVGEEGASEGQPGQEDQQPQEGAVMGEGIGPGQVTMMSPLSDETKQATASNFMHVAGRVQTLWDEMDQKMQKRFKSIMNFANFFTGARAESFEKRLVNSKLRLVLNKGVWETIQEPPQEAQTSMISETFRDLVDMVADGKCDPEVLDDFKVTKNDDVLISPKGDKNDRTDALAFSDRTGFLRMLLKKAEEICGKKVGTARLRQNHSEGHGGDNAIRGFAFEDILEAASLLRLKAKLGKGQDHGELQSLINEKLLNVHDKLSKLTLSKEAWIKAYEESGLDPTQVEIIREISQILEGGAQTNNLYASMLKHSNQSIKVRGAIYALPVGDQTGQGQRQDVLEIYDSYESAIEAAKRSGVEAEPTCYAVENAFVGGSESTLSALKGAGVFRDGQKVCALKVSLKNYFSLKHAVFGGGRFTTFNELINSDLGESKFRQTISKNLGMSDDDHRILNDYSNEMEAIGGSIFSVPEESIVKTKDGMINQKTARVFAEQLLGDINKNHTYVELESGELRVLKNLAENVISSSRTKHEVSASYVKLQNRLNQFLQQKKAQKDIKAGGDKARGAMLFLAHKMFHAGGSDDDNLVCDYRELLTGNNYVFKQNDPLRDGWRSVLAGDGEWSLDYSPPKKDQLPQLNLSRGKTKISLKNELIPSKNSKGITTNYNMNFSCQVNKACLEEYDTSNASFRESRELGELLSRIELLFEKARMLTAK